MSTIHVIQGGTAAASLREALAQAGRDEHVVGLLDDLGVGPLKGADETPDTRAAFWQRVLGDQIPDWNAEIEAEFARLDQLATETGQVVVWHAPSVGDKLLLRRVAYHLRNVPQRLNEVRLSAADLDPAQRASLSRTDQERIVRFLGKGLSVSEVARRIGTSRQTVMRVRAAAAVDTNDA